MNNKKTHTHTHKTKVHLYRPAPTVVDLSFTAEGMVDNQHLRGYLKSLAQAYVKVYCSQNFKDFWGLREFYSTVSAINEALHRSNDGFLTPEILFKVVLRNFGGRPHDIQKVTNVFFEEVFRKVPPSTLFTLESRKKFSIQSLVRQNLRETSARHLMLLTKNNAALSLLFDHQTLKQEATEVIFGSDFPLDQSDLQICVNIQRIKSCMAEGRNVILVHCDSLYESLYDLLNQV
jgi:E3 ubiquitin-protein ligase RNF213